MSSPARSISVSVVSDEGQERKIDCNSQKKHYTIAGYLEHNGIMFLCKMQTHLIN